MTDSRNAAFHSAMSDWHYETAQRLHGELLRDYHYHISQSYWHLCRYEEARRVPQTRQTD